MVDTARDLSNFSQHGMIHFGEYCDIHSICNSQYTLSYILVLHVIFRNLTTMYVFLASPLYIIVTPWTAAHQAPPSMGFSRQEYWSGLPLPSPLNFIETVNIFSSGAL